MTSIRRLPPGIASSITRSTSLEVTAPVRKKEETAAVEPVRRGFSDQSDFQPGVEDESPLYGHAPLLSGRPGAPTPEPLRSYTGASDFQARAPKYGVLLGTNVPPPRSLPRRDGMLDTLPASRLQAQQAARPTASGAPLEQALALAPPDAQVLFYAGAEGLEGHAVVRHWDGHVTDPNAPTLRYPDTTAWERSHPGHARPTVLSRDDVELVLGTPEGPERDELLAYFAPESGEAVDAFEPAMAPAGDGGFMADLSDLPLPPAPEELLAVLDAGSDTGFVADSADVPSVVVEDAPAMRATPEAVPAATPEVVRAEPLVAEAPAQTAPPVPVVDVREARATVEVQPERLRELSASDALDFAQTVARAGTPEQQTQVATALYARSQTPEAGESAAFQRAAALSAAGSPEATQALLTQVGEAHVTAFVRTLLG
jgi:hypothetical protein